MCVNVSPYETGRLFLKISENGKSVGRYLHLTFAKHIN